MSDALRYVVLRHDGVESPHFDLLFETRSGSPLVTFRSAEWPIVQRTPVEPLPDHRREYLDYQGPVSGNRGVVQRVESGRYLGTMPTGDAGAVLTLHPSDRPPQSIRFSKNGNSWIVEPIS